MQTLIILTVVLSVVVAGLVVWLIASSFAGRREVAGQAAAINILQQQLETLRNAQDAIRETLQKSLEKGQENLSLNLRTQQETLNKLNKQIGSLEQANQQWIQLGTDVRKLQDILKSPKLRGQLGEWSLENLLATILPQESFRLQHQFRDGKTVDALIKMPDYSVPVDAKFPLPGFEAMLKAESDTDRGRLRKQFQRDVAGHIDKIAASYIRPGEGTLDFALMYVPAENIYYETIIKQDSDNVDVLNYALDKKVIPVSPNLLYAYLMTIVMGLHGMQIEKQAAEIRQNLKKLSADFGDFGSTWDVLGRHLRNAQNQYEDGNRKFNKFSLHLQQIEQTSEDSEAK